MLLTTAIKNKKKHMETLLVWCITLLLILPLFTSCTISSDNLLRIDVLDIGKADCIIIRNEKNTIMIDTGEEENLPKIESFLKSKNIKKINCLILSHYDKDHIGGAEKILTTYDVETVLESSFTSEREEYTRYHNVALDKGITISKLHNDTSMAIGNININISTPKKSSYEKKEDNNASLVVSLKFGERTFLFCGDAMNDRMNEILLENLGQFDLVKLPHHGSFLKNYDDILHSFACKDVIITDSEKNPADEKLISLLNEKNIRCYESRYGTVSVTCDGKKISIEQ